MARAQIFTYWKNGTTATLYEIDAVGATTALYSRPIFWSSPQHISAAYDGLSLLLTSSVHTNPSWPTGIIHRVDLAGTLLNTYNLGVSNLGYWSAFQYDANNILAFVADLTGATWHFWAYIIDVSTGATVSTTSLDALYVSWASFPQAVALFAGSAFILDELGSPNTSTLYELNLSTGSLSAVGLVSPAEELGSPSTPRAGTGIMADKYLGPGSQSTVELWKTDQTANTALAVTINVPFSVALGDYFRYLSIGHDDGSFLWLVTQDAYDFNLYQINENDYSGATSPLLVVTPGSQLSGALFNVNFAFIGGDVIPVGGWSVGSIRIG